MSIVSSGWLLFAIKLGEVARRGEVTRAEDQHDYER